MEIVIKPHHYMDMIKLYGSGLDRFVPDLAYPAVTARRYELFCKGCERYLEK